ncbi:hypothetical protein C1646_404814 [Rhizophagus diaphanus]|nr:hypothetical protein C1646_404814 [Rhizophagus diaphanus] [Rhizophagus sp. MUCL 43196]
MRYKLIKGLRISCLRGKLLGDTYQWWRALAVARECGSRVVFYSKCSKWYEIKSPESISFPSRRVIKHLQIIIFIVKRDIDFP